MRDATRPPKLSDLGVDLLHLTRWQRTRAIAGPFAAFAAYWILAGSVWRQARARG